MIPHCIDHIVEECCFLLFRLVLQTLQNFLKEINIVSSACFDNLLLWWGTLSMISFCTWCRLQHLRLLRTCWRLFAERLLIKTWLLEWWMLRSRLLLLALLRYSCCNLWCVLLLSPRGLLSAQSNRLASTLRLKCLKETKPLQALLVDVEATRDWSRMATSLGKGRTSTLLYDKAMTSISREYLSRFSPAIKWRCHRHVSDEHGNEKVGLDSWIWFVAVCPYCCNCLTISKAVEDPQGRNAFTCRTCPYQFILDQPYYERTYMKKKQMDDTLGEGQTDLPINDGEWSLIRLQDSDSIYSSWWLSKRTL